MAEKNTTQRELTCICCPVGCALTVTIEGDNSVTVTGNRCPRGAAYGEKEVTNPTRIVTSTVRVEGYPDTVVSVKTASDIPKGRIDDCMKALADVTVAAPIHVGDVIVENVADTGVNIVATRSFSWVTEDRTIENRAYLGQWTQYIPMTRLGYAMGRAWNEQREVT